WRDRRRGISRQSVVSVRSGSGAAHAFSYYAKRRFDVKSANLVLRFLLELAALAALAHWGATASTRVLPRIVLGIGAPLAMATFWGIFVAPRARVVLPST